MEEADSICDRIAIIDHGKIIALDKPSALKDSLAGDTITVETAQAKELADAVKKIGISKCSLHDGKVTFCVDSAEKRVTEIISLARDMKIAITSVELHKPTLDDVFLHYTGKTIREEESTGKDLMRMRRRAMHR
jgi:ABC-2 type transport system ATP-binding protein